MWQWERLVESWGNRIAVERKSKKRTDSKEGVGWGDLNGNRKSMTSV